MFKPFQYFLLVVLALTLAGCGEDIAKWAAEQMQTPEAKNPKLGELEYRMVNQGTLKHDADGLFGIGDILFVKALPLDNAFTFTFSLEERGSLSLVANSNEKLETGVKITFLRLDKLVRLQVETSKEKGKFYGYDETPKTFELRLDPTKPITLEIDLHAHGHFMIKANGQKTPQIGFEEQTARFAGLLLHGVKVTEAKVGPASKHGRDR